MRRFVGPALLCGVALAAACGGDESAVPSSSSGDAGTTSGGPTEAGTSSGADSSADAPVGPSGGVCSGKTGASGDRKVTVAVGAIERTFDLHVPPKYDAGKATPLVLLFHGYTMTAESIAAASKFSATADAHGMIVAYPTGLNAGFNAGECCGASVTTKVDDLGFTREMLRAISKEYCVDDKRIYSTGFSNGGFMSYDLACEMSETFAAVASVSGTLGIPPDACKPKRPIALLHIHGTADLVVPFVGGGVGANRSVAVSVQTFRTLDKCTPGDGTNVYAKGDASCTQWACDAGTHVQQCTIQGGGHQWPGGETLPFGGSASPNLDASEAIARFFEAHPLP